MLCDFPAGVWFESSKNRLSLRNPQQRSASLIRRSESVFHLRVATSFQPNEVHSFEPPRHSNGGKRPRLEKRTQRPSMASAVRTGAESQFVDKPEIEVAGAELQKGAE